MHEVLREWSVGLDKGMQNGDGQLNDEPEQIKQQQSPHVVSPVLSFFWSFEEKKGTGQKEKGYGHAGHIPDDNNLCQSREGLRVNGYNKYCSDEFGDIDRMIGGRGFHLENMLNILQTINLLEVFHDGTHFITVVYTHLDGPIEDTVIAGDGYAMDADVKLAGDDLGNIENHSLSVDTLYLYRGIKEEFSVHVPFGIEYTVAKSGLQFRGHGTCAHVNLHMVLVIDKSQCVIAGDGMAALGEDEAADISLCDDDGALFVERLIHDKKRAGYLAYYLVGIVA